MNSEPNWPQPTQDSQRQTTGSTSGRSGCWPATTQPKSSRAEIDALNGALDNDQVTNYESNIARLTEQFGLSETAIVGAFDAAGQFDLLLGTGVETIQAQVSVLRNYEDGLTTSVAAQQALAAELELSSAAALTAVLGVDQLAASLGVTSTELGFLASRIEGVDFADLFDEDPEVRIAAIDAVSRELNSTFEGLAASSSSTADALLAQAAASASLVGANENLAASLDNLVATYGNLSDPIVELATAQMAYNDALASGDLDAAADAAIRLVRRPSRCGGRLPRNCRRCRGR